MVVKNPVFELPFRSFNDKLFKRPEDVATQRELGPERKWVVEVKEVQVVTLQKDDYLSEYECLQVRIQGLSIDYAYTKLSLRVLDPACVSIDFGLKNETKSAILQGTEDTRQTPEVFVKAALPDLELHVTPDVFNGMVNIVEVIKVVNAEEQMQDLIKDKLHLWEKAIVKCYLKVKGTRQSLGSWTYQYLVLSGSYLYFYERSKDLMPANHFYACDWAIIENAAGTEASIVTIKSNKQEVVLLDFCGNLAAKKQFCEGLLEL